MRPVVLRGVTLLLAFAAACAGFNVGSDDGCAAACATAHQCGFLPSGLGYGADSGLAIADCERRCGQSPRGADDIEKILSCLDGSWEAPDDLGAWCLDEDAELGGDLTCATASQCLWSEFPGGRLQGDVHIEVSLMSFTDFTADFGDDALTEVYAVVSKPVSSCAQALCGRDDCTAQDDLDHPCDATLCGRDRVNTGEICSDLGATVIELGVDGRYGPPITQVLLDDDAESDDCKDASRTFAAEDYAVRPGPAHVFARVSGRLPASELARIGVVAEDEEDGAAPYCLAFPGMTATLRAGQNVLIVPIATIDALEETGLRPTSCQP